MQMCHFKLGTQFSYQQRSILLLWSYEMPMRVFHSGIKQTLTEVRTKFWIIKVRSAVKKMIHQCVICRRYGGRHYRVHEPPPLPRFRVGEAPPAGPIM
jgi:hypothetical protein